MKRICTLAVSAMLLFTTVSCQKMPTEIPQTNTAEPLSGLHSFDERAKAGRFAIAEQDKYGLIYYIDMETESETLFCQNPDCSHDTPECPAVVLLDQCQKYYTLDKNRLLLKTYEEASSEKQGEPTAKLILKTSGQPEQTVLRTFSPDEMWAEVIGADEENVYLYMWYDKPETPEYRLSIMRQPLDGSPWEEVITLAGEDRNRILNDKIYVCFGDWLAACIENDDGEGILLCNVYTGEVQTLQIGKNKKCYISVAASEDRVYWNDIWNCDKLVWVNLQQEIGTVELCWEELGETPNDPQKVCDVQLERIVGDTALIKVGEMTGREVKRYAVDLNTGKMQKIPLRYLKDRKLRPIEILSKNGDRLLVEFETRTSESLVMQHGCEIKKGSKELNRWGFIDWNDFINGVNNYRELSRSYQ